MSNDTTLHVRPLVHLRSGHTLFGDWDEATEEQHQSIVKMFEDAAVATGGWFVTVSLGTTKNIIPGSRIDYIEVQSRKDAA